MSKIEQCIAVHKMTGIGQVMPDFEQADNFLLDPNGAIIAKKLTGPALSKKLEHIFYAWE